MQREKLRTDAEDSISQSLCSLRQHIYYFTEPASCRSTASGSKGQAPPRAEPSPPSVRDAAGARLGLPGTWNCSGISRMAVWGSQKRWHSWHSPQRYHLAAWARKHTLPKWLSGQQISLRGGDQGTGRRRHECPSVTVVDRLACNTTTGESQK